jgi:peptidoglycan/xylan/chitin deacetylase (PgdA/CDA1 family)
MKTRTRTVARAIGPLSRLRARPLFSVLAYHRIDQAGGGMSVSPHAFRSHLDWLDEHGIQVVPLEAFCLEDGGRPRVALTFDDGYRSVADVAWPELRDRGLPATLYVVSRTLRSGHRFSWDASTSAGDAALIGRSALLDLAADGLSIGSHTRTHVYLPSVGLDRVKDEVGGSREELEDELGRPVTSFSYPQGGWNASIRSCVARAGYATAVTMDRGANSPVADPLTLARRPAETDPIDFEMSIEGLYDFLRPIDTVRDRLRQRRSHLGP